MNPERSVRRIEREPLEYSQGKSLPYR